MLVLCAGLTTASLGLQFSHFPPVSRRSDQLPPPGEAGEARSPTGRPGLLAQQDQRDHLLALLAAPGPSGAPGPPGPQETQGRPRQKMTSRLLEQSLALAGLGRSRTSQSSQSSPQLAVRKLNLQRRLRGPARHLNSLNVGEKIEKSLVLRARPRARTRSGPQVGQQRIANRKKIVKKLKVQEGKKEGNEVDPGKGLIQRRVRVKPQRKSTNANVEAEAKVDADKVAGRQFQRRLRPRLEEIKEESRGEVISSRLSTLARSRPSNKDRDDISGPAGGPGAGAGASKYEVEPQLSTLRPENSSRRPTIESLNIDPRRTQPRKYPASSDVSDSLTTSKPPLTIQLTESRPTSSVTEKGFSLLEERFLPTIRNLISKKSRKRFRKIKTNAKSGRRRLKGENDLIIDTAKFREKQNLNLETTTTLVNLITTTTTLINLITSSQPVAPALRKIGRARGGGGARNKQISEETATTNINSRKTTTGPPTTTSTTTTTSTITTSTTTSTTTTSTTTTTTKESERDVVRVSTVPNDEVEERTVYNPHKSRVSSRRNEITGSQLNPLTYDLEKALKHAELTWAQDPFRKTTGLPGKPIFDIDFSKNPSGPPVRSSVRSREISSSNLRVPAPVRPQTASPSPSSDRSRKPLETILWTPAQLRGLTQ